MNNQLLEVRKEIHSKAIELGFSHCGFALAEPLEELKPFYADFVSQKRYARLEYLGRYAEQKMNPSLVFPEVKSVIALLMNYSPPSSIPDEDNFIIAKYAYGKDDHVVVKDRVKQLERFIAEAYPSSLSRSFYDSGPVAEKAWAQRCGIGWQGKNTLLINRNGGSFCHIGIIFTDLMIEPDKPETDHCGTCTKCINACPTGALDHPYQLSIDRCLSYHTIENRGEVPEEIRGKFRDRIYGCDICQDVCPYNQSITPHDEAQMMPHPELRLKRKKDWLALTEEEFDTIFGNTTIKRTGFQTLKRNMEMAGDR